MLRSGRSSSTSLAFFVREPMLAPGRPSNVLNAGQVGGIIFEALRLILVQRLLSSPDFKMDPLLSLYYYAPACAVINGLLTAFVELPRLTLGDILAVGVPILVANAFVAFLLNVSVVLLVGPFP